MSEECVEVRGRERAIAVEESVRVDKKWSIVSIVCAVVVAIFSLSSWMASCKAQKISDQLMARMNSALAVQAKSYNAALLEQGKKFNEALAKRDDMILSDRKFYSARVNALWQQRGKDAKLYNGFLANHEQRIIELHDYMDEDIKADNETVDQIEKDFDAFSRKLEDLRFELDTDGFPLGQSSDNEVKHRVRLDQLEEVVGDLKLYQTWLESKYLGLFKMK